MDNTDSWFTLAETKYRINYIIFPQKNFDLARAGFAIAEGLAAYRVATATKEILTSKMGKGDREIYLKKITYISRYLGWYLDYKKLH